MVGSSPMKRQSQDSSQIHPAVSKKGTCTSDVGWLVGWLAGWLCLTSHRQRGHLETAPPFTVPCEGRCTGDHVI